MRLENQVCSLRSSERLVELGINEPSWFWWKISKEKNNYIPELVNQLDVKDDIELTGINEGCYKYIPAYSVAELGWLLPHFLTCPLTSHQHSFETRRIGQHTWKVMYCSEEGQMIIDEFEVEARARLLIYLLENKLYKKTKDLYPEL